MYPNYVLTRKLDIAKEKETSKTETILDDPEEELSITLGQMVKDHLFNIVTKFLDRQAYQFTTTDEIFDALIFKTL